MRRRVLAAHLQRAEGVSVGSYIAAGPAVAKAAGTATRRIGGVICLTAAKIDSEFLNRALGFGTIADATSGLLDRIERHYERSGKPPRISIATGCVRASAVRLLERRGYLPQLEYAQLIYVYDRARPPLVPSVDGLTIERVTAATAALYAKTGYESFRERGPEFRTIIELLVRTRRRGLRAYLGRIDGEPAATGMLTDIGPVGALGNGSVRRKFRGRGIQVAMIAHRINEGWRRGYRIFFGETGNPASAHNMEELGWRKLYDEVDWERPTAR
jgi:GNAT superfamily N-acetyltransferase